MSLSSQREFLNQVKHRLDSGFLAYKDYISQGSIFRHAERLRRSNEEIKQLILAQGHRLPHKQRRNAEALLGHINIWSAIWDRYYETLKPQPDDRFIFENDATFPREAVDQLMEYFDHIRA